MEELSQHVAARRGEVDPVPRWLSRMGVRQIPRLLHRTLAGALAHDSLNLAQSAAYSAIVALFPALIVLAALLSWLPVFGPVQLQIAEFFDQILPANVFPLLTSYFGSSPGTPHTARLLLVAIVVSLTGASSVIATLMEGLRRAEQVPEDRWNFWQRRARALLLVPLSLIPLATATALVMFGELIRDRFRAVLYRPMKPVFYALTQAGRWSLAIAAVACVTALLYHLGTPPGRGERASAEAVPPGSGARAVPWHRVDLGSRHGWSRALPGAIVATLAWFAITLVFGWYVTRYANYNQVYGPLGAGIALLFWLYIVFFSVLFGAEFNAQVERGFPSARVPGSGSIG